MLQVVASLAGSDSKSTQITEIRQITLQAVFVASYLSYYLNRNRCNLVGICPMVNAKSCSKLDTFDLDR